MAEDAQADHHRRSSDVEAPRGPTPGGSAWATRLLLIAGVAPVNFALVIPRPVLKSMAAELGGNATADLLLKMIISVIGLSVVIGAPVAGVLIRRFGQRISLIASFALFVVAGCLPFFLHDLYSIIVSRAVLGFAVAAIQVAAVSLCGELPSEAERAKILGFMMASASLAALVLAPLAGVLGEFGWRMPFLLHLAGLPFLVLAIIGLPRSPIKNGFTAGRRDRSETTRFPYLLAGLGFVGGSAMTLPPIYLAFRLGEVGVGRPAMVGLSFVAISIPDMICASFYGYLRRKQSIQMMSMLGFGFAALGLGSIAISANYIGILVGMAMLGVTNAFVYASVMERASSYGERRSQVAGIVISAIFLSLAVGTFVVEPIYLAFGSVGVMAALAIVSIVMVGLFSWGLMADHVRVPAGDSSVDQ